MPKIPERVARGLLLHGEGLRAGTLSREDFMSQIGVIGDSFRSYSTLGAGRNPGLRFFSSERERLKFGPGAGLILAVSVGQARVRTAIVDANGEVHHPIEGESVRGLRTLEPEKLFRYVQAAARGTLANARADDSLFVEGALRLLGVAIAWCSPLDRLKRPMGNALSHPAWHDGGTLIDRTASALGIDARRVHAINDAHAAAVSAAFDQTRTPEHSSWSHPNLALSLRLAGGVGGAVVVVEPPESDPKVGSTSGFPESVLTGGRDMCAGEIGHVPVVPALVDNVNKRLLKGVGKLQAVGCSCAANRSELSHLEAFTSVAAVAARLSPGENEWDVIDRVIANPTARAHARVLSDAGSLIGQALLGPVAMLNPATITLTGTLAVSPVGAAIETQLASAKTFGDPPQVVVPKDRGMFAAARGAALVVIRRHVHRRFHTLVGESANSAVSRVAALTEPLPRLPWE